MNKVKATLLSLMLLLALAVVAGCGGSDKPAQTVPQAQQAVQAQDAHSGHSMPSGDPMPLVKDMDKNLQDMVKQIKAGQMMDVQKSAAQVASLADKVVPHISDNALREQMKKAAYELRDAAGGAKIDQAVVEAKLKAMQDTMGPAMKNLQSGAHNH